MPPHSVLEKITKELSTSLNRNVALIAKFPLYGNVNKEGIQILKRFHILKRLHTEVALAKKWIKKAFQSCCFEKEVMQALLDRWNLEGTYLVSYDNYRISSQGLSSLCGERLSDEVLNFLGQENCNKANLSECIPPFIPLNWQCSSNSCRKHMSSK